MSVQSDYDDYPYHDIDQYTQYDDQLHKSNKVNNAVSRWRGGDLAKGLIQSKFIIATLFGGLAVGALFAIMVYGFGMMPSDWMITATAIGGYVIGILVQLPFFQGLQKLRFELASFRRLFNTNYNEIISIPDKGTLYLGALPNRLRLEGETLVNKEKVSSVLSVNEPWERLPYGLSLPYSRSDWEELDVHYAELDVKDHSLLGDEDLNKAAKFIHDELEAGRSVFVHCRAGIGRSGMAIAAYLVKYRGMTVDEAANQIKSQRPNATIQKKLERLDGYRESLGLPTISNIYSKEDAANLLKNKEFLIAEDPNIGEDQNVQRQVIMARDEKGELHIIKNDLHHRLSLLEANDYQPYRKRVIKLDFESL